LKDSGQIALSAHSCIETVSRQLASPPKTDWIFFYSPNSVELFFEHYSHSGQKLGAIGTGTSEVIKALGMDLAFDSDETNPELVVEEFAKILKPGETVLSPFGNLSQKRLSRILTPEQIVEFEHYETRHKKDIPVSTATYLLFTSPSNAEAYLGIHKMMPYQKAVAIGQTTFKALEDLGVENKMASQTPSEEGFWEAIQKDSENKKLT
jgi:uroporphyrinogen-III synthase